jgi:mannose-1-phosphate guanylyltransferase
MIAETMLRLDGLAPVERTYIVTHESHVVPILDGLGVGGPPPRLLAEPFGRDTAACIGLAAVHIRREDPEGVMLVLAADHAIRPTDRFQEVVRAAAEMASTEDCLVTFGIKPRYPATGYGYVHRGPLWGQIAGVPVFEVLGFREKPAKEVADEYLASGQYYWNSGMFCWRVATILDCIRRFAPKLHDALERIASAIATPAEEAVVREVYEPLEKISIDYAVMEHAETIRVVEADFEWSDVGSWASVAKLRRDEADPRGNVEVGRCELLDVADSLVLTDDQHLVGVVGMRDVVVVHTPDATLVCPKHRAEEVKKLVELLSKKRLTQYL